MKTTCIAAAFVLLAGPAAAMNRCTGPDGRVTFQDVPCGKEVKKAEEVKTWDSRLTGYARAPQSWAAHRVNDGLTAKISCTALSPSAIAFTRRSNTDLISLAVVIVFVDQTPMVAVRLNGTKNIFHNDLSSMGIKLDNLPLQPLDLKAGQAVTGSSKSAELIRALPSAKSITLRVRLWPHDELIDSLPIPNTAFASAYAKARRCAGLPD